MFAHKNKSRSFIYFYSLWETIQTLFWAVFGLVDLDSFELDGIKIFTRFWGMLMFGCYSVINIVVLLNLLIAMMNHSYQLISVRAEMFNIYCCVMTFLPPPVLLYAVGKHLYNTTFTHGLDVKCFSLFSALSGGKIAIFAVFTICYS